MATGSDREQGLAGAGDRARPAGRDVDGRGEAKIFRPNVGNLAVKAFLDQVSQRTNDVVFANDGKTLYVVDYGELYVDFSMPSPFFQTPKSSVIWKVTYTGN